MAISPADLSTNVKSRVDFNALQKQIDALIISRVQANGDTTEVVVVLQLLPDWVANKLCEAYLSAGWSSVEHSVGRGVLNFPEKFSIFTLSA